MLLRLLTLTVLAVLILSNPSLSLAARKTVITGYPPYELGMPLARALRAGPTLTQGAYQLWSSRVSTLNYKALLPTQIAGQRYTAELTLQFYRGVVGAIGLYWPSYRMRGETTMRGRDLYDHLINAYDPSLIFLRIRNEEGVTLILKDKKGNSINLLGKDFDIGLSFLSAQYEAALKKAGN